MKILSLFDWMSCAQIALNRIWIKDYTYYASEVDKYAIQVAQKNYPNTKQIGDVRKVRYCFMDGSKEDKWYYLLGEPKTELQDDMWKIENIDLLIWWSPCQDLSIAGKRKWLECERLQTVPDNYINSVSDSQRYKMLWNWFCVDVIAHILKCFLDTNKQ